MTTSGSDIIGNGTDGHGEASAGSSSSFGRTKSDPADAETVSGSTSGNPPVSPEAGGTATGEYADTSESQTPQPTDAGNDALAEALAERDEYLDLARRTQADLENLRKRAARERAELRAKTIADVIRDLLPVVDNIDRALQSAQTGEDSGALLEGIKMVHLELHSYLDRLGLKVIETEGATFDPALHEAIASVPVDGVEAGQIHEVHQKGFQLDEIVVRPARVVVTA
ncbi:MAG: nucleotide exchange factor GrpE [Actinobacteria bacterium]|nr:nucleotide exchange factor GrpE [Actinomycetota bacterium]